MTTMIEQIERAGLRATLLMTAALFVLFGANPVEAQIPAPTQSGVIALTGGTIHTVSNGVVRGTILFEDGVITAIGTNVQVPSGAQRVDITGKHVYPGLIDAFSAMGLFEIGGFDVTIDLNELGDINPNVRAEVAFNPESRHIGVARSNGVLVSVSSPTGGLISGMAAAMMMDGWTYEQMLIKSGTALMVNWPNPGGGGGGFGGGGGGFGGGGGQQPQYEPRLKELRDVFATARAYRDAKAANPSLPSDSRWEAMIPVLNGDVPVVVNANDLRQIQDAVTWSEEEGVRLIIRGGRDAGYVADHLARRGIPVVLTSVLNSPNRDWAPYDTEYSAPSRLHNAGVRFAISAGSSAAYANRLPYEAGTAVAFGLPEDEAVKSVTLYPAQFLGIDDRVGSLETGKDATLLITTGNPLDYPTIIEQAYIQGRKIDMNDAHRNFFEKYQEKSRRVLEAADRN